MAMASCASIRICGRAGSLVGALLAITSSTVTGLKPLITSLGDLPIVADRVLLCSLKLWDDVRPSAEVI